MDPIYQAHPVPQNISSFEFHLVGDMTLKQFAYLAIGLAIAYLTFILWAASSPYLAWPIIATSAASGAAFAFLPIAERPLDHWLAAFFKAIFHPTTRTFRSPSLKRDDQRFTSRLALYLNTPNKPPLASEQFTAITPPAPTPSVSGPEQPLPSEKELEKTVELAKEAQDVQDKIIATEQNIAQIKAQAAGVGADPKAFTERFQQILANLQRLNQEASTVSQQLATIAQEPVKSPPVLLVPIKPKVALTLTLTTVSNIINGIVTDIQGNYLEAAIIVAHDKHGLPVRALKTNKLGQFIAATPLPNGIYTLTTEKDDLSFDRIQLDLKGQVLKPLLISAKKGVPND